METKLIGQCRDDLSIIACGIKTVGRLGRKVVVLAANNNHRNTIVTKLRFLGVQPYKFTVVTLAEVKRLQGYKNRELIIPKWTVINMLREGKCGTRGQTN